MAREFFIVDRDVFLQACERGMNAAVSYLVMARGTQGNNRTTKWSANAIAERAGITRPRATAAIGELIDSGVVELVSGGARPHYRLHLPDSDNGYLYLPNSIIDAVGEEIPPIERLRQTRNITNLKVFILLYGIQDLDNAGGLPSEMFDHAPFTTQVLYSNNTMRLEIADSCTYKLSWSWYGKSSIFSLIYMDFNDFTSSFFELKDMGLVSVYVKVFDSPDDDGEIIGNTCNYSYVSELDNATRRKRKTTAKWPTDVHYMIIPAHIKSANLKCIGVMRYRAQTSKTARWMALESKNIERADNLYSSAVKLETALAIERESKIA